MTTLERQLFGQSGRAAGSARKSAGLLRLAAAEPCNFKELTELPLALSAKLAHMLEQKEPRKGRIAGVAGSGCCPDCRYQPGFFVRSPKAAGSGWTSSANEPEHYRFAR